MSAPLPPIYRDCQRLLAHTEEVVRRFSRYHKYTVGADLRQQAMVVMRTVHRAVYDKAQQAQHVQALVWCMDDYKLTLQLAMDVGAFVYGKAAAQKPASPGFAAFETAAQLAAAIGKQCGGWLKQLCRAGTNVRPPEMGATANRPHAQAGNGSNPAAAGLQPAAIREDAPQASPASLSARTTFTPAPGVEVTP